MLFTAGVALLASCARPSPSLPLTIVADPGRFATIEAAGAAEDSVDWWDADVKDDEACTESFAALELAKFLPRALGIPAERVVLAAFTGELPERGDVIVLGARAANTLGRAKPPGPELRRTRPDAFRLAASSERGRTVLLIEGATRSGTLAGAYTLLDRLGVGFHRPGDSCVAFPKPARLPARAELTEVPVFDLRGFWAWEPRGDEDFFLWMARNRFNLWTDAEPRITLMKKLGIRLSDGGHTLQQEFLDPRTRFNAHPEWFGFEGGRRRPGIENEFGLNFCTSNPEARREFARGVVRALATGRFRHTDVLQLWPLDGGRWCECAACQAQGSPADRWLEVAADAVAEVEAARRGGSLARRVTLMAPAYLETMNPPTRQAPPSLESADFAVAYFPYFRCYAHPLGDPRCYEINRSMAARYLGWTAGDERPYAGAVAVGEYYNVSWVKSLPVVYPHVMAADLFDYARTGARDVFYMHAPTRRFGSWALNHALLSRLMWNPAEDVDSLVREFTAREYPGADTDMRAFYAALETATSNLGALQHAVGAIGTGNNPRLLDPRVRIFALRHMTDSLPGTGPDSSASVRDMARAFATARQAIDAARERAVEPRVVASLRETEERFAYGEAMFEFWAALAHAAAAHREGRGAALRAEMTRADSAAARLREVRDLVRVAASHSNAADGLEASGAVRVYERLRAFARESPPR